jgi:hypothetical protein
MDLDMDAPSPVQATAASKTPPRCVASAALELLHEGLRPFILTAARAALGEELYSFYLPPDDADAAALLRYVRAKWLAVFSDTPLEPHAATIDRLVDVAVDARRARNPLPQRIATETARDVETILIAIRKPALAARVAQLAASSVTSAAPAQRTARPSSAPCVPPPSVVPVTSASDPSCSPQLSGPAKIPLHGPQPERCLEQWQASTAQNVPVALDGSNIAWRHGASKRFSIRGVAEALAYFAQRGHPSVVFLPEARMRVPPPSVGAQDIPEGEAEAFAALQALEGGPQLVLTPEKDYDDCYLTHFARAYQAVVVSNDAFADQVYQAEAESADVANEWRRWLAACRLSYTFHGHAFVPNPAFSFKRARVVAQELCTSSAVNRT